MAKSTAKITTAPAVKKAPVKKTTAKAKTISLEKVAEDILEKLKALNIEHELQADIEWCLGSYRYDHNAAGLIDRAAKALSVFKAEQAKKTKGVTATLITTIESVLK